MADDTATDPPTQPPRYPIDAETLRRLRDDRDYPFDPTHCAWNLAATLMDVYAENAALRATIDGHAAEVGRLLTDLRAAEARAAAYEPDAVVMALREGRFVDNGCSRDPSRYDIHSKAPWPACATCGAIEGGPCVGGVAPEEVARATEAVRGPDGVVDPIALSLELFPPGGRSS